MRTKKVPKMYLLIHIVFNRNSLIAW